LDDLIAEARKRQSASEQVIATVSFRYISTEPKPKPKILIPTERVNRSRAELEMTFRQSFLQLESALRNRLKSEGSLRDRRTLGNLICEAEKAGLFSAVQIAEAWFVNAARNSLSHPGLGEVSHSSLTRATQAATELSKQLS